jgi:hypothetical protein
MDWRLGLPSPIHGAVKVEITPAQSHLHAIIAAASQQGLWYLIYHPR